MAGKFLVSGATGDVLTIPAPTGTGKFIRIKSLFLSVSAASTVTLKSTSTTIGEALLGTGNAMNMTDEKSGLLDCLPGNTFVIGNSAGTIRGYGVYEVVG